jgi:hypothetical protein
MPDDFEAPVANPLVVLQPTETGAVLMDVATGDCFELNRIGTEIWKRVTEGKSREAIVAALASEYDVPGPTLEADVGTLLRDLSRHGLLTATRR